MILLDTSGLFAALDRSQRLHQAAKEALLAAGQPRILSPFVLAELDYMASTRMAQMAERSLLDEVARGVYRLEAFDANDVRAALGIISQHANLGLGLADASIVVLAERYQCEVILTLDERHFRALHGPRNQGFRILPADM